MKRETKIKLLSGFLLVPLVVLNLYLHFNTWVAIAAMGLASIHRILGPVAFVLPSVAFWVIDTNSGRMSGRWMIGISSLTLIGSALFWWSSWSYAIGYHGPEYVFWAGVWAVVFAISLVLVTAFAARQRSAARCLLYSWILVAGAFTWLFPYLGEYP